MSKIDFYQNDYNNAKLPLEGDDFTTNLKNTNIFIPKIVGDLQLLVNDIMLRGNDIKKFGSILATPNSFTIPDFLSSAIIESNLSFGTIKPADINQLHIGAIDGGLVSSSLAGFEVIGLKGVGVYLNYGKGRINKVQYYPKKHQDITLIPVFKNFNNLDFEIFSSLQRSILELKTAIQLLEESPAYLDFLLMDGSFQLKRVPTQDAELNMLFGKYFAYLRKLMVKAQSQNTQVVFVVKDSKTTNFITILSQLLPHIISSFPELYTFDYRSVIRDLRDSNLMHYLLKPRTRSFLINRSFSLKEKESLELNYNPFSFYLKVVKNDLPLRIDLLTNQNINNSDIINIADIISKVIITLSEFNQNYSLPAPLIEADARARINLEDFELILDYIRNKTYNYESIEGLKLRRSRSPFKF